MYAVQMKKANTVTVFYRIDIRTAKVCIDSIINITPTINILQMMVIVAVSNPVLHQSVALLATL